MISAAQIIHATERYHRLATGSLTKPSRFRHIAWPRQMAMYAIRSELGHSFPRIARRFGMDPSTVIYSCRTFSKRAQEAPSHVGELRAVMGLARQGGRL